MATTTRGEDGRKKRACVTGGSGYLGSMLVKCLLENGYSVHTTVRDTANEKKVSQLLKLQSLGDLKLFKADLTEDGSFDKAIDGCDFVFNVATPIHFESQDQENDVIKPGIKGMLNVLKSCAKVKTVKRVVYTSSISALSLNQRTGTSFVVDEESWSDVEYLTSKKPPIWGYAVSKTLAERAGWEFAKENKLDLVTVAPVGVAGPSITQEAVGSIHAALSLLTGNEYLINAMKDLERISGSTPLVHVEDVCRAHIFVAENESASGRYICCAVNTRVPELAQFLAKRYPHYNVPTDNFMDVSGIPNVSISSNKLIKAGFTYKYGIEEIFDDSVEYFKEIGLLAR